MKFLPVSVLLLGSLALGGCHSGNALDNPNFSDAEFAKVALTAFMKGEDSAQDAIDWENLKIDGTDVGAEYRALSDDSARYRYRKDGVAMFAVAMNSQQMTADNLCRWHVESQDGERTVVVADVLPPEILAKNPNAVANGAISVTVSKHNQERKLVETAHRHLG